MRPPPTVAKLAPVRTFVPRTRLNRRDLAAAALGHATAVLGDPARAELVALAAVRRSLQSRTGVLAHARHLAISQMRNAPELDVRDLAQTEVREFAQQLAMTRTPLERSVVDLSVRQSLDMRSLGRVLGIDSEQAALLVRATTSRWEREIDPAVMAWLGPGSCTELAAILTTNRLWPRGSDSPISSVDTTGEVPIVKTDDMGAADATIRTAELPIVATGAPLTIHQYLDAAPLVASHAESCEVCAKRLQSLNGVMDILAQVPLPTPSKELLRAIRPYKTRIATPLPPSIEPRRYDVRRLRTPGLAVAAVIVIALGSVLAFNTFTGDDDENQDDRVDQLVVNATATKLVSSVVQLSPSQRSTVLTNQGSETVLWHATSSATWLKVEPVSGRLSPGQSVSLGTIESPKQSQSRDATIEITSSDQSRQILSYRSGNATSR